MGRVTLWLSLNKDEAGVILTKTLEVQTDNAPAQYQFKHLSFQEGLYAQHLLQTIEALRESKGHNSVWEGWSSDFVAAEFLNNAYMNNVCRIASGRLGRLLATQRTSWDFSEENCRLGWVGRSALWLIMDENYTLSSLALTGNEITNDDAAGLGRLMSTCSGLQTLNLASTSLGKLDKIQLSQVAKALGTNTTVTELNLSGNGLGPEGTATIVGSMHHCLGLRSLNLSDNQPGREMQVSELLKVHTSLTTLYVVEPEPKNLDSRVRDAIGRAMLINAGSSLQYLECDAFALRESTSTIKWKGITASDAIMLAGCLKTNTVLTSFELGTGELDDNARETIGRALLLNKRSRMGFCDDYGLLPDVSVHDLDLKANLSVKKPASFMMLAGVLSANTKLEALSIRSLDTEHIEPLAQALRSNRTIKTLTLHHTHKTHASEVSLPVQQLNGSSGDTSIAITGELGRVTCAVVGHMIAHNTSLEELKLCGTQLGIEGGNIFDHLTPSFLNPKSRLTALDLSDIQLGDRGGTKLFAALLAGTKSTITKLMLGSNGLRDETGRTMNEVLRTEGCTLSSLDLSGNQISGILLARALKFAASLTQLDVRGASIDDEGYKTLGGLLLMDDSPCKLAYVQCDQFDLAPETTELSLGEPRPRLQPGALTLLAGVLKYNRSLTRLSLSNAGIDAEAAEALATALQSNKALMSVDFSGNAALLHVTGNASKEDLSGLRALTKAVGASEALGEVTFDDSAPLPVRQLKGSERVASLDLSGRKLGFLSATVIGGLLPTNSALTDLNLMGNEMGSPGCRAVAQAARFSGLRGLNLMSNALEDDLGFDGVKSIAGAGDASGNDELFAELMLAIGQLSSLERLSLDHNEIIHFELLSPICRMGSLQKLHLANNRLSALPESIGQLRSLTDLGVHNNALIELPASIGRLAALEKLSAQNNALAFLPESFGQLNELKTVSLVRNGAMTARTHTRTHHLGVPSGLFGNTRPAHLGTRAKKIHPRRWATCTRRCSLLLSL